MWEAYSSVGTRNPKGDVDRNYGCLVVDLSTSIKPQLLFKPSMPDTSHTVRKPSQQHLHTAMSLHSTPVANQNPSPTTEILLRHPLHLPEHLSPDCRQPALPFSFHFLTNVSVVASCHWRLDFDRLWHGGCIRGSKDVVYIAVAVGNADPALGHHLALFCGGNAHRGGEA